MGGNLPDESVEIVCKSLTKGQYCTEQCLWLFWKHRGDMCAIEESDVFGVDSSKFYEVILSFPDVHQGTREYAVNYWVHCRNVERRSGRKISDLPPSERISCSRFCII